MCRSFDSDASNSVNRVELTTLLDALGSTYTEETIDMIFISQGVSPETDQLTYDRVFEAIESKLHDTMELTAKLLQETSLSRRAFQTSHMERLFQIKNCPMCRKNLANKMDMDVIAHIALCKLDDYSKLDNFVLGGFLTESYASRKWYTKIINRVTFGKYSTGNNNGQCRFK